MYYYLHHPGPVNSLKKETYRDSNVGQHIFKHGQSSGQFNSEQKNVHYGLRFQPNNVIFYIIPK